MAFKDQPSYIIKMRAKPGKGDRLFELATIGNDEVGLVRPVHHASRGRRPRRALEHRGIPLRRSQDAYETSDMADELRDEIIDLLAEPPVRIEAHPYSAIPALPGDTE